MQRILIHLFRSGDLEVKSQDQESLKISRKPMYGLIP